LREREARAYVRKDSGFSGVFVVGADADADVEVAGEGELDGGAGGVELAVGAGDEGIEEVAALFEADAGGRGDGGLNFVVVAVGLEAELHRCEAVAVARDVDRGGAGVEGLADHKDGFAMGVALVALEGDVGGKSDVAGDFFPCELEVIFSEPHVISAASESVGVGCSVVVGGARMKDGADVGVVFEDAELLGMKCR